MSKILVIDTSSDTCSVVLCRGETVASKTVTGRQSHAAQLLRLIGELLEEEQVPAGTLDALAVVAGPGSFTGLRIGISVVQGLAFALDKPVVLLSTLELLALSGYYGRGWTNILCATLARDGEIYFGGFIIDGDGFMSAIGPELVGAPGSISVENPLLRRGSWHGLGDGWIYANEISSALSCNLLETDTSIRISTRSLAVLAQRLFSAGKTVAPDMALPSYLKEKMDYKSAINE